MHVPVFPNVMATYSFAVLKDSVIKAYRQETQFVLTETVQLFRVLSAGY